MIQLLLLASFTFLSVQNLMAEEVPQTAQKHEHTHQHQHNVVIEHKKGMTFDEMVQEGKGTIVPGFVAGLVEGVVSGGVKATGQEIKEFEDDKGSVVAQLIIADTIEGMAAALVNEWRETESEFSQRKEGATGSYVVEKMVHNMTKYVAGLAVIDCFTDKGTDDRYEQKIIHIEQWFNTLFREKALTKGAISKGLWHAVLKGTTEGVYAKSGTAQKDLAWSPELAGSAVFATALAELIVQKYTAEIKNEKRAKRYERLLTSLLTGVAKAAVRSSKNLKGEVLSIDKEDPFLDSVGMGVCGAGITGLAWISQHEYGRQFVRFLGDIARIFGKA